VGKGETLLSRTLFGYLLCRHEQKVAGKLYYVGPVCGPGEMRIRETKKKIDGSPLIALNSILRSIFFVESDESTAELWRRESKARAPEKYKEWKSFREIATMKLKDQAAAF